MLPDNNDIKNQTDILIDADIKKIFIHICLYVDPDGYNKGR